MAQDGNLGLFIYLRWPEQELCIVCTLNLKKTYIFTICCMSCSLLMWALTVHNSVSSLTEETTGAVVKSACYKNDF